MRRLLSVTFLGGILLALAIAGLNMLEDPGPVKAGHINPGGPTTIAIDMQESATPANTRGSGSNGVVGSREPCVRVNENDMLDADEDTIAIDTDADTIADFFPNDAVNVDATIEDVTVYSNNGTPGDPSDDFGGITAHSFLISYSETNLTLQHHFVANMMIGARAGSSITDVSEPTPDIDNNDTWAGSALDTSAIPPLPEDSDSIMDRLVISSDPLATPGLYAIDISGSAILDASGAAFPPHNEIDGTLAVDTACPTPVDVKLVSQTVTTDGINPFPASITASQNVPLQIDKILHNNTPPNNTPTTITKTITLSPDCTLNGQPNTGPYVITVPGPTLAPSVPTTFTENDVVHCTDPSNHQLVVQNCANPPFEINNLNNCDTDTVLFIVTASADLKITAQSLSGFPANKSASLPWPPLIVNQPQGFTLNKTVHNNGPADNVAATITPNAFVTNFVGGLTPTDCTITNTTPPNGGSVVLAVSTPTGANENFSINCGIDTMGNDTDGDTLIDEDRIDGVDNDGDTQIDEDSGYLLPTVCVLNNISADDPHVTDPTPANNNAGPTCQTLLLERAFTPSFSVTQDEGQVPSDPGFDGPFPLPQGTPPIDDTCS